MANNFIKDFFSPFLSSTGNELVLPTTPSISDGLAPFINLGSNQIKTNNTPNRNLNKGGQNQGGGIQAPTSVAPPTTQSPTPQPFAASTGMVDRNKFYSLDDLDRLGLGSQLSAKDRLNIGQGGFLTADQLANRGIAFGGSG